MTEFAIEPSESIYDYGVNDASLYFNSSLISTLQDLITKEHKNEKNFERIINSE